MKIQDSVTAFKFPHYENEVQSSKMVKDILPAIEGQHVKVSISNEGYENYRAKISGGQSYSEVLKQRELLTEVKLSPDMNYNFALSAKVNSLNEADKALSEHGYISNEDRLNNIMEAYTSFYSEITQGYENGTREINVVDNESELGYRALTMQEELAALDDAYKKAVDNMMAQIEQEPKIQAAFEKYISKLQKIGADRAELANAYVARNDRADILLK